MKKTTNNLILVSIIFAVALVTSNVVAVKLIDTGIFIGDHLVLLPGAALLYALTFLMSDIVAEIWGKKQAKTLVIFGVIAQAVASIMIMLTQYLPAAESAVHEAYVTLLGQNYVFVFASLTAYFVSQMWDVHIFHKVREAWMIKHKGSRKQRWIWNNLSTTTSQLIDTFIFIGVAFGIGFGWLFDPAMVPTLMLMIIGQYLFKGVIAIADTPFFYLLTRDRD